MRACHWCRWRIAACAARHVAARRIHRWPICVCVFEPLAPHAYRCCWRSMARRCTPRTPLIWRIWARARQPTAAGTSRHVAARREHRCSGAIGHLRVCRWLRRPTAAGTSQHVAACREHRCSGAYGHVRVCRWCSWRTAACTARHVAARCGCRWSPNGRVVPSVCRLRRRPTAVGTARHVAVRRGRRRSGTAGHVCARAAGSAGPPLLAQHDTSLRAAHNAELAHLDACVRAAGAAGPPLLAQHDTSLRAADAADLAHLSTSVGAASSASPPLLAQHDPLLRAVDGAGAVGHVRVCRWCRRPTAAGAASTHRCAPRTPPIWHSWTSACMPLAPPACCWRSTTHSCAPRTPLI